MTPVYEIRTKHTKQMLMDFIKFTNGVRYPRVPINIAILAICFFTLAFVTRHSVGLYICSAFGLLLIIFLLTRKNIAFNKLSKVDANYINQSDIHMVFGHSGFNITNEEDNSVQNYKYGEVTNHYFDNNYYYIQANNEDLHMIPKADFIQGDAEEFKEFMIEKTDGKPMDKVNMNLKEKWEYNKMLLKYGWENRGFTQFDKKDKKK